jgi:hypothetical protein
VIIAASVSDEQAKKMFGGFEAPRPSVRIVFEPNGKV